MKDEQIAQIAYAGLRAHIKFLPSWVMCPQETKNKMTEVVDAILCNPKISSDTLAEIIDLDLDGKKFVYEIMNILKGVVIELALETRGKVVA